MNIPKILTITSLCMVTLCHTLTDASAIVTGLTCWDSTKQCCQTTGSQCNETQCQSALSITCDVIGEGPIVSPVICTKTCPAGEYGDICNDEECKPCPAPGTSNEITNTKITGCHIPAGTVFTDSTGTYEYTSKCYYTN